MADEREIGTVISSFEGPSPNLVDFVVTHGIVHRGQFVELDYSEGTMVCLVNDVIKTNRYFERADSVKEFESSGTKMLEQFPIGEWEYLLAKTRPLGVFADGMIKRPSYPPSPGTKVRISDRENLKKFLGFDLQAGLEIGTVEYHDLPVKLNLSSLLKKHLAVLAMSGAGKCVTPETKVLLSDGAETEIGTLVEERLKEGFVVENGVQLSTSNPDGLKVLSLNENNEIVASIIKAFTRRRSPKEILKIKTASGRCLEITEEHQIPVLDNEIKWVQAAEIKEGQYFLLNRSIPDSHKMSEIDFSKFEYGGMVFRNNGAIFKKVGNRIPERVQVDENFAKLMGYLLAEGHNTGETITFSNYDEQIQNDFAGLMQNIFGIKVRKIKRFGEVRVYNKLLATAMRNIGFTSSSYTKFVPNEILSSNSEIIWAFLGTFIDCDGHVNKDKSEIEICLASEKLIDGINSMLLRQGIVAAKKIKLVKGRPFHRLSVRGSKNLSLVNAKISLCIDYKSAGLDRASATKSNPNLDVVPNIQKNIGMLLYLLRMPQPQSRSSGINNYLHRRDNPTRESLAKLIMLFRHRLLELEVAVSDIYELKNSLRETSEKDALETILKAREDGFTFAQIADGCNVSSTTARRVVKGITAPTNQVYSLAGNVLQIQEKQNIFAEIGEIDLRETASKIKTLCEKLGFETQELCRECGVHKRALYEYACIGKEPHYSTLVALSKRLCEHAESVETSMIEARNQIFFLESLIASNLYFDRVTSILKIPATSEFVYDLSVEMHNFIANGIVVHNSYGVSVLLEELLSRKKEAGRIATIVMDPHGEYSSFAEPVKEKGFEDFSSMTRLVKAGNIRIGVPRLDVNLISGIIPGLSHAQKRDLGRVLSQLKQEMRDGLGPFDLAMVRLKIVRDNEIKESTKAALIGWVDGLEDLHLFGKTDNPGVAELAKPGTLTIVDLSDIVDLKKKQVIVGYFARKLFHERREKAIPPFLFILEEAHQFCPEKASEEKAVARGIIRTIAREGRKFGASLCLISQRPVQLDTTTLSQCNTHIILRITNPYDLKHIGETSEGIDARTQSMISSLRVGEGIIVGEAVNFPVFFKFRKRKSAPSRHEFSLEQAAIDFENSEGKNREEAESFL